MKDNRFIASALWPDEHGIHINAHGGGILEHEGVYYWYGEHKIEGEAGNKAHVGVHVYASTDLVHWRDEGVAFRVSDDPSSSIARGCVLERPKVVFNRRTGRFVMWFHLERSTDYSSALSGVAVADRPTGPFAYLHSLRPNAGHWPLNVRPDQQSEARIAEARAEGGNFPNGENPKTPRYNIFGRDFVDGQHARDMTLFLDEDGTAYHVYSSEHNSTLHIASLTDDFLNHSGRYVRAFENRWMEAPALFKRRGRYYLIASGCTGWAPNAARSAVADSVLGPWREMGNPCVGMDSRTGLGADKTFGGQSTFVLPVSRYPDAFIAMFDRWRPENAIDGRYLWLPIRFLDDGRLSIEWMESWDLSVFESHREID